MIRIQNNKIQNFEIEHMDILRRVGAECTLLLKKDGTLPLKEATTVALYGSGARNTIKGGTGSGDVNVRHFVNIEEGLEKAGFTIVSKNWLDQYDALKADRYQEFTEQIRSEAKELGLNPVMYGMGKAMPEPEYKFSLEHDADIAVYVLSRNSGEGSDRSQVSGDIDLSQTEIRDILELNRKFGQFVLVLNVGGMVNLSPVANVKNILLLSQLGMVTGEVLADLLLGNSYPSGKLAMTWAPIEDYASTEGFGDLDDTYYREGIYVGYRYFDSYQKVPTYPFGFGLSYTDFALHIKKMESDGRKVKITVSVENIGMHVGKEVVQVYVSAPTGRLDKPYQELKAFAKTEELVPGECETLELQFDISDLASYDTEAASYIMEAGDYVVRVGNSSRHTEVAGILRLDKTVYTEKVRNICKGWCFEDRKPEGLTEKECFGLSEMKETSGEKMTVIRISGESMIQQEHQYGETPKELPNHRACMWDEVKSGAKTLDEFVGSLTEEQMVYVCNGTFMEEGGMESQIGAAAVSIAGGAGETTFRLSDLGVPTITMADGPAGLRLCTMYKVVDGQVKGQDNPLAGLMDFMEPEQIQMIAATMPKPTQEELDAPINYVYCSAIPIGTALAQSWNINSARICGDLVGAEMERFGVHLWLAPAMNIQRSPLCGRNFEYYSEDPLVSGWMAAAVTAGVQAHPGCGTTIKHFACNNQETNRMVSNSIVSERALREIYLKGFEICVKNSHPYAIMSSYNLINGEHACNSKDIMTYVLRHEWGYEGIVMTDWYASNSMMVEVSERKNKHDVAVPSGCIKAGNDLIMPGTVMEKNQILNALNEEKGCYSLSKAELQIAAKRVLHIVQMITADEIEEI